MNHRHADFQSAALPTELPGRRRGARIRPATAGRVKQWPGPKPLILVRTPLDPAFCTVVPCPQPFGFFHPDPHACSRTSAQARPSSGARCAGRAVGVHFPHQRSTRHTPTGERTHPDQPTCTACGDAHRPMASGSIPLFRLIPTPGFLVLFPVGCPLT